MGLSGPLEEDVGAIRERCVVRSPAAFNDATPTRAHEPGYHCSAAAAAATVAAETAARCRDESHRSDLVLRLATPRRPPDQGRHHRTDWGGQCPPNFCRRAFLGLVPIRPVFFSGGGGREFIKKGANLPTSVDVHARESFLLPGA